MKLIDRWPEAYKFHSVKIASFGVIASAVAAGIAASGLIVPWLGLIPTWAVFVGGSVIFALTVLARITAQKNDDACSR